MSLADRAARGTGVTMATQALRAALQLGSVVVLARVLDPADFGLVAMVTAVIGVADLVRDAGLSSAVISSKDVTDDEQTNLFWASTGLGLGCAVAAAAAAPAIAAAYGEDRLTPIVLALAGVFVISGAGTQFRADLTRRLRFTALSVADLASQACGIAVAVGLAVAGAGLWALVAQQLTTAAIAFLVAAGSSTFRPTLPRRRTSVRRFFRYGGGVLGTQAVQYSTRNVDNVALGVVWGALPVGLYSRAYQLLLTPLSLINAPMSRVALPVLSRVVDDRVTYARYVQALQLVACYLTATVFAVAAGLASPVVLVLLGERWAAVAPIFAVLAVAGLFRAVSQVSSWIYLSHGRPGAQLRQSVVTGPVMVVLVLAGLPWGPLGVATGHASAAALLWAVALVHAGRVTGVAVRPLFANAARAVLLVGAPCGALAAAATHVAPVAGQPLAQIALGLALAAAWAAVVVAVVPAVRADAATLVALARRATRRQGGRARPGRREGGRQDRAAGRRYSTYV